MSNINDYLAWRGDLPINSSFKFNEVDSMILARFSYLLFHKIEMNESETISSIADKMKDFPNEDFRYNGDKKMITRMGESARFKDLIVTDYVEIMDKETQTQFSAITIHISAEELYISYIGTDNTIVGWKEDFNLTFMDKIPAQIEGLKYLSEISKKYPDCKLRIGGHSKGGNVAIYSAVSASGDVQEKIVKVYNYDGPGLDQKVIANIKNKEVIKKLHTYIPQDSIIGRLLWHEEDFDVIKSIEKGLLQHDIFSWQIFRDTMVRAEKVTNHSDIINSTVHEWFRTTTPDQRKIFIDGVYEVFSSTKADTINELTVTLSKNIPMFFKRYNGIADEDKKVMTQILKEFGKAYALTVKTNNSSSSQK